MKNKNSRRSRREGGFTMFFALLAVSFLASYTLLNINLDADRMARERARQSAWLISEISHAARLYVRDNSVNESSNVHRNNLCTTPREIAVNDLLGTGTLVPTSTNAYISPNIGRRNPTDTRYMTSFGQEIRIIAANSDLAPASCDPTALTSIAASAYIVLTPSPRVSSEDIALLAESLREYGLPAFAPNFDASGGNISPSCGGGPSSLLWDTGCLNEAQYTALAGTAFAEGAFGLPVWLSFRGDNRAIFRFPQPENPQAQQMATDLRMAPAPAVCTEVQILNATPSATDSAATTSVNSGVCQVTDDTAADNNRHNIVAARNIEFERAIVTPQAVDRNAAGVIDETDTVAFPALGVSGASTITGAVRSFARTDSMNAADIALTGTSSGISVAPADPNWVANPGVPRPRVTVSGDVLTGDIEGDRAELLTNTTVTGATSVSGGLTVATRPGLAPSVDIDGVGGSRAFVAREIGPATDGTPSSFGSLSVNGTATIAGGTTIANTMTLTGNSSLSIATASLRAGSLSVPANSPLRIGSDLSIGNDADIGSVGSVGTCYGQCPQRGPTTPPPPLP